MSIQDSFNQNDGALNAMGHMAAINQRNQQIAQQKEQAEAIRAQTAALEEKNRIDTDRAEIESQRLEIERQRLRAEEIERDMHREQAEQVKQLRNLIADNFEMLEQLQNEVRLLPQNAQLEYNIVRKVAHIQANTHILQSQSEFFSDLNDMRFLRKIRTDLAAFIKSCTASGLMQAEPLKCIMEEVNELSLWFAEVGKYAENALLFKCEWIVKDIDETTRILSEARDEHNRLKTIADNLDLKTESLIEVIDDCELLKYSDSLLAKSDLLLCEMNVVEAKHANRTSLIIYVKAWTEGENTSKVIQSDFDRKKGWVFSGIPNGISKNDLLSAAQELVVIEKSTRERKVASGNKIIANQWNQDSLQKDVFMEYVLCSQAMCPEKRIPESADVRIPIRQFVANCGPLHEQVESHLGILGVRIKRLSDLHSKHENKLSIAEQHLMNHDFRSAEKLLKALGQGFTDLPYASAKDSLGKLHKCLGEFQALEQKCEANEWQQVEQDLALLPKCILKPDSELGLECHALLRNAEKQLAEFRAKRNSMLIRSTSAVIFVILVITLIVLIAAR